MSILVTGSTGLVGSHLSHKLVENGYKVLGMTHHRSNPMIESLLSHDNFSVVKCNILDRSTINKILETNQIDAVFHLSAHIPHTPKADYMGVNVCGTYNLLVESLLHSVRHFIYVSSMSVYDDNNLPVNENGITTKTDFYGISKLCGEFLCERFSDAIFVSILRYASVYGKGARPPLVAAKFVECARNNLPITIYGDGKQSKEFVYIDDVVNGTLLAWKRSQTGLTGLYNIGSGQETTITQLAQKIKKAFHSKSEIVYTGDESPSSRFVSDISNAKRELGYSPMSLDEGIKLYAKELGC